MPLFSFNLIVHLFVKGDKFMIGEKILVVDDDISILELIKTILENKGYKVIVYDNGKDAASIIDNSFKLVILDVMMPKKNGIELCIDIRKKYKIPILFLSAKSSEYDKYIGLSIGGDDYLSKPFSTIELLARVNALIRRYTKYDLGNSKDIIREPNIIKFKDIVINKSSNKIYIENKKIDLTTIEYRILMLFIENPDIIFSLKDIYEKIWNEEYMYTVNGTIMVHIRNLRKKLDDDVKNLVILRTFGEGDIVLYRNIDKFFPIRKQMIFVIIFAFATCSGFLYTSMTLVEVFLDKVIFSDENLKKTRQEYILKIQNFIDENNINTKNLYQLYEWNSNHKNIFLRLYEDNELIYDSRVGMIDEKIYINNQYKKGNINKYIILSFKDKNLVARIIAIPNYIVNQTIYHLMVFISFCIFLFIILKCTNKKIRYLELIKKQLEEDEKIDIKGNDEITHVANAINIMLDCLNEKMESERISERIIYKGNMELITSLSHDIRTPLTSLIGY